MGERAIDRLPVEIWREIFDKLLTVDFRSPLLQPSVPWSRRKREFDTRVRYSEMLRNRERLRLVAKKWKAIVETYPWRRLDLVRLDGPPPEHHSRDVLWVVYPFSGGYQLRDRFEDLVQSASTIVVFSLIWHAKLSLTRLYCLFAHASSFRRLQKLIVDLTFSDRTSNDLATHTFFSHINAFPSTLITLSLNVTSLRSGLVRITPSSSTHQPSPSRPLLWRLVGSTQHLRVELSKIDSPKAHWGH